ncbi:hypothetical protein AAC691_04860 [Nguyenibacter vanlangensis]|uniref:Uncharacterized protein n=1 Tax=Nguyenibacter vanlangensis TaxID=1216886 RepID=A0ABZ3D7M2_9PROT
MNDFCKTAVGFTGLSTYRTDVDAAIAEADRVVTADGPIRYSGPALAPDPIEPVHHDRDAFSGGIRKAGGWVIGIGIMVAIRIGLSGGLHSSGTNTPDTHTPPPAASTSDITRPAIYSSSTLSIGELRYCLAEGIRLGGEQSELNDMRSTDVARYNRNVDSYNALVRDFQSRCAHRSFFVNDKEITGPQIEEQRSALVKEGRDRVL